MLFLSKNNILGADKQTIPLTPSHLNNLTCIVLKNGMYDCLYITKETSLRPSDECLKEWDFNTIFHACFHNSTNAGNVDWNLKTVSHLLVKRKDTSKFKWITLAVKEIKSLKDFSDGIKGIDYTNACGVEYEYAVVPVLYGTEGLYNTTFVHSQFDDMFLTEKDCIIGTPASDGLCNTIRRIPSSVSETVNNRYPTYIRNTAANYDKGSCKGKFIELDEDTCEFAVEDALRVPYQRKMMDFIANGMPKLLKHFDGRIWLIVVTGDPTDTAEETYNNRSISFEWAEIGSYESERDLYYTGLSDIEEEWWNT